jgi:hypothetical protein
MNLLEHEQLEMNLFENEWLGMNLFEDEWLQMNINFLSDCPQLQVLA